VQPVPLLGETHGDLPSLFSCTALRQGQLRSSLRWRGCAAPAADCSAARWGWGGGKARASGRPAAPSRFSSRPALCVMVLSDQQYLVRLRQRRLAPSQNRLRGKRQRLTRRSRFSRGALPESSLSKRVNNARSGHIGGKGLRRYGSSGPVDREFAEAFPSRLDAAGRLPPRRRRSRLARPLQRAGRAKRIHNFAFGEHRLHHEAAEWIACMQPSLERTSAQPHRRPRYVGDFDRLQIR